MTEYNLIADFGIDHNELAGVSPETAFILGAEFIQVRMLVQAAALPVETEIHRLNSDRCIAMLTASGLVTEIDEVITDNITWCKLIVKEPPPEGEVIPFRNAVKT